MYGSRIALAGLLVALGGSTAAAEGGTTNAGRLALLAGEAAALSREAELATGQAPSPPPAIAEAKGVTAGPWAKAPDRFGSIPLNLPPGPVGGAALGALALAALATYLVTRARAREATGSRAGEVREVTWRFRSPQPIRIGGESTHRVAQVLDEIEQLGQQLRAITTAPRPDPPARVPEASPEPEPEPVVFARRAPVAAARTPEPEPAPIEGGVQSRAQLREAIYTQARRLLRAGGDRFAVREATGLKLAEIDLLRCARAGEKAA